MQAATEPAHSRPVAAAVITLLGGVLIVVSDAFMWGRISVVATGAHDDIKGGTLVVVFGIAVIAVGLLMLVLPSRGWRIALAVLAIVAGLASLLIAGVSAGSKDVFLTSDADRIASARGADPKPTEQQFKGAERAGVIKVTDQPGVFVALGGGLLALVGGVIGAARSGRRPVGVVPPPPPPAPVAGPPLAG
jgi:hypothetical protein